MDKRPTTIGALGANRETVGTVLVRVMDHDQALRLAREVMSSHAGTLRKLATT